MPRNHNGVLPAFLQDRVLPSSDPREVQRALLRDLLETTHGDVASIYTIVRRDNEPVLRVFGVMVIGNHPPLEQTLRSFEGLPVGPVAILSSLTSASHFEVQHREDMPDAMVQQVWAPHGVHSCVGINLLDDDGHHVAWIGAFRLGASPLYPRQVPSHLDARIAPYRDLLIAAHRFESTVPNAASFVLDQAGGVVLSTPEAERWLEIPGFRDGLMRDLAELQHEAGDHRKTHFRTAALSITCVEGRVGRAYLVSVTPQPHTRLPVVCTLSRVQRSIVELAALGLTISEIAEQLGRSQDTVRFHLKAVYNLLGIASRAELALAMSESF